MLAAATTLGLATKPLIVCTTAPSLEGMAFCRSAIASGEYRVRALCRNPQSPRAAKLASMGAELCVADNHDVNSLRRAFQGADGIYAITTWSGSGFAADGSPIRSHDLDAAALESSEVAQGLNILRAAESTPTLKHVVLQSMHRAGRKALSPDVPAPLHHRAKWRLEDELRASKLESWSILRQPTYLENFGNDEAASQGTQLRRLRPGVVSGLLGHDEELTVIAVKDLGEIAIKMLARAEHRHTLAAGAERVTGMQLADSASRVNLHGVSFKYQPVPWAVLRFLVPVDYPRQLRAWLSRGGNDEGNEANLAASREIHPDMQSVEDWLREHGVDQMQHAPSPLEGVTVAKLSLAVPGLLGLMQGPAVVHALTQGDNAHMHLLSKLTALT